MAWSQFSWPCTQLGSDGARRGGSTVVNCEELTGELVGQEWAGNQPDCNQRSTDDVHHEDLWVFVFRSPREDLANPDLLGDQAIGHIYQDDQSHTGLYESHQAPSPSRTVKTPCWSVHNCVSSVYRLGLPLRNCEHLNAKVANMPWWSWGESKHRNLSYGFVEAVEALCFRGWCSGNRFVSVL